MTDLADLPVRMLIAQLAQIEDAIRTTPTFTTATDGPGSAQRGPAGAAGSRAGHHCRTAAPRRPDRGGRVSLAQRGYIGRFLHQGAQGDALGDPSGIRERRVPLEHLVLGRTDHADLEEVVHDPEPGHPRRVGVSGDTRKRRPDSLRGVGPGEFRDLDAKFHVLKVCR